MKKTSKKHVTHVQSTHAIAKSIAPVENVNSWDAAIAKARHKIATLKRDIAAFQEMKDSGERWPGTQSSDQNSERQHSV
jgi:hypothetical protein